MNGLDIVDALEGSGGKVKYIGILKTWRYVPM